MEQLISEIKDFLKQAKNPLIVIGGPTASGKTKLAVKPLQTIQW